MPQVNEISWLGSLLISLFFLVLTILFFNFSYTFILMKNSMFSIPVLNFSNLL